MYNKIVALYELFYQRLYKNKQYIYTPSQTAEKQIENFIKLLDKKYTLQSIGDNFLITYFIFQFAYWSELDIDQYNKTVVISYIIGPKAFQRWLDRDMEYDYTINSVQIEKTKVTRGEAMDLIADKSNLRHDDLKHEEVEKKRFKGTDKQLNHCIDNTTLYSPRSITCLSCKEKDTCKAILEARFPQIYYHRFKKK